MQSLHVGANHSAAGIGQSAETQLHLEQFVANSFAGVTVGLVWVSIFMAIGIANPAETCFPSVFDESQG